MVCVAPALTWKDKRPVRGGVSLLNFLWPANSLFGRWDLTLLGLLLALTFTTSYLVTLYPSLRASFGGLNQQLKE